MFRLRYRVTPPASEHAHRALMADKTVHVRHRRTRKWTQLDTAKQLQIARKKPFSTVKNSTICFFARSTSEYAGPSSRANL